jgi:hypothetical protein
MRAHDDVVYVSVCGRAVQSSTMRSVYERREWFADLDDVGGQHPTSSGSDVECVVRGARRDEERIAGVEVQWGLITNHHLHCAGEDVADLFTGVNMPPGLDSAWDFGQHDDDFAPRDRGRPMLHLDAFELAGQLVGRLVTCHDSTDRAQCLEDLITDDLGLRHHNQV